MSRPVANRPTQPVREDAHLPYESTPMPVSAMAASYPHGTWIAPHRHRRAQLLYAIEGVMHVQSDGASWIVPPTRGVWLEAGLDHTVQMSGNVEMRTVFVEPGAVEHLPGRSCVVEVHPLLRELILAAVDVPLDYAPGSRHDHLMRLLLAEVTAAPLLPLYCRGRTTHACGRSATRSSPPPTTCARSPNGPASPAFPSGRCIAASGARRGSASAAGASRRGCCSRSSASRMARRCSRSRWTTATAARARSPRCSSAISACRRRRSTRRPCGTITRRRYLAASATMNKPHVAADATVRA